MGLGGKVAFKARSMIFGQPPVDLGSIHHGTVALQMLSLETWLRVHDHHSETRVSVVTATRNRPGLLSRAASSVQNQHAPPLEWIVVNDGDAGSCDFLRTSGDAATRIEVVEAGGVGLAAARNLGLAKVTGDVVAYLDDDNVMSEGWVRSLAFALDRTPGAIWGYGARVVETPQVSYSTNKTLPFVELPAFSRSLLRQRNYIDANVLFHRPDEWRFDENTSSQSDWELVLRLDEHAGPLRVPAFACLYGTQHEGRMSDGAEAGVDEEFIRRKHGLAQP